MRPFLLLLLPCLLPFLSYAQLFGPSFEAGLYKLKDSPTVWRPAQLKQLGSGQLAVKGADGKTVKLPPAQVLCYRLDGKQFRAVPGFHVPGTLGGFDVEPTFAEQLDSGRVMLLRYQYSVASPMTMGAGGMMTGGGGGSTQATYLLSYPDGSGLVAARPGGNASNGKNFREAVRPFLASRPDLVKYLDQKRINTENLPSAINSLNRELPFTPPAALNLE